MFCSKMMLVFSLMSLLLFCACGARWHNELASNETLSWPDKDRNAFFYNSPWAKSDRAKVSGWASLTSAGIETTATFLTPNFLEKRKELLAMARTADWPIVEEMVTFDEDISGSSYFYHGPIVIKEKETFPFTHKIAVGSKLMPNGLGLFPTGAEWLDHFYNSLQLDRGKLDVKAMLSDEIDFKRYYAFDVAFVPYVSRHRITNTMIDPDRALTCAVAESLKAEVRLVRQDGEELKPADMIVLWHDLEGVWHKSLWMKGQIPIVGTPAVVRIVFDRRDSKGRGWLDGAEKVSMKITLPAGKCGRYAQNREKGLKFESEIEFDLLELSEVEKGALVFEASSKE